MKSIREVYKESLVRQPPSEELVAAATSLSKKIFAGSFIVGILCICFTIMGVMMPVISTKLVTVISYLVGLAIVIGLTAFRKPFLKRVESSLPRRIHLRRIRGVDIDENSPEVIRVYVSYLKEMLDEQKKRFLELIEESNRSLREASQALSRILESQAVSESELKAVNLKVARDLLCQVEKRLKENDASRISAEAATKEAEAIVLFYRGLLNEASQLEAIAAANNFLIEDATTREKIAAELDGLLTSCDSAVTTLRELGKDVVARGGAIAEMAELQVVNSS